MKKTTLKPLGFLKQYINNQDRVNIEPGKSVFETLMDLNIPSELVAAVFIGDKLIAKDYLILEGDDLIAMAVIGGGIFG